MRLCVVSVTSVPDGDGGADSGTGAGTAVRGPGLRPAIIEGRAA